MLVTSCSDSCERSNGATAYKTADRLRIIKPVTFLRLIGFLLYNLYFCPSAGKTVFINDISILPEEANKGVAFNLMFHMAMVCVTL